MVCVNLRKYQRNCAAVTGGVSDIAIFDPSDLDFTQGADDANGKTAYSAVEERDDVDGASIFMINFQVDEAEWTYTQSKTGCATKYEHNFNFQLPDNSQNLSTFMQSLDSAGCCCGIGIFLRLNSGKIFVAGEKYVNGDSITRFQIAQDGTEGGSGKLFDDFNGGNLKLKGNYSRNLYEYSGTWASIEALAEAAGSGS
jgi:hypothetical protein